MGENSIKLRLLEKTRGDFGVIGKGSGGTGAGGWGRGVQERL